MKQAWAQNAVITSDDGKMCVRFRPRCPECGHVPVNIEMGGTAMENCRSSYYATCDKCGKYMEIVIGRG